MKRGALSSPLVRVGARALIAGLAAFFSSLQAAGGALSSAVVSGAATAAGLAALEVLTPLNPYVGPGRSPPAQRSSSASSSGGNG